MSSYRQSNTGATRTTRKKDRSELYKPESEDDVCEFDLNQIDVQELNDECLDIAGNTPGVYNVGPGSNAQNDTKLLRYNYQVAKLRAKEMKSRKHDISTSSMTSTGHKVYTAIAAILNASIGLASADSLERYVQKTVCQLPIDIIDFEVWSGVLSLAREKRGTSKKFQDTILRQKKEYRYLALLSYSAAHTWKREMLQLRANTLNDIQFLKDQMKSFMDILPTYAASVEKLYAENKELKEIDEKERYEIVNLTEKLEGVTEKCQCLKEELKNSEATIVDMEKAHVIELDDAIQKTTIELTSEFREQREAMVAQYQEEISLVKKEHADVVSAKDKVIAERISTIAENDKMIAELNGEVSSVKQQLVALNEKIASSTIAHEATVAQLETMHEATIKRMQSDVDMLKANMISSHARAVSELQTVIDGKDREVELHSKKCAALQESINALKGDVESVKQHETEMLLLDKQHEEKMLEDLKKNFVVKETGYKDEINKLEEKLKQSQELQSKSQEQYKGELTRLQSTNSALECQVKDQVDEIKRVSVKNSALECQVKDQVDEIKRASVKNSALECQVKDQVDEIKRVSVKSSVLESQKDAAALVFEDEPVSVVAPSSTTKPVPSSTSGPVALVGETARVIADDVIAASLSRPASAQPAPTQNADITSAASTVVAATDPPVTSTAAFPSATPSNSTPASATDRDNTATVSEVEGESDHVLEELDSTAQMAHSMAVDYVDFVLGWALNGVTEQDSVFSAGSGAYDGEEYQKQDNAQVVDGAVNSPNPAVSISTGNRNITTEASVPTGLVRGGLIYDGEDGSVRSSLGEEFRPAKAAGTEANVDGGAITEVLMADHSLLSHPGGSVHNSPWDGGQAENYGHRRMHTHSQDDPSIDSSHNRFSYSGENSLMDPEVASLRKRTDLTFGEYVDQQIRYVFESFELNNLASQQSRAHIPAMELPIARSLRMLQQFRVELEAAKNRLLLSGVEQSDRLMNNAYNEATLDTTGSVMPGNPIAADQAMDYIKGCIGSCKHEVDTIRAQVNQNRELVRQLSDLVPAEELKDIPTFNVGADGANRVEHLVLDRSEMVLADGVEKSVVKIQSVARGFLGRKRAQKQVLHNEVIAQGVLAAALGTVQGDSGWYECKGMLFYFCVDDGEFVLLCGPITEGVYKVAKEELRVQLRKKRQNDAMSPNSSTIISKSPSASKVLGNITLDRLAIQATRTQIQLLLDSVRTRDKEIAMMRHEFVEVKQQWMDELEEVQMIHSRACELHAAEVKEFKSKISGYLAEMRVTRNEHNTLLQQHSLLKESLAECQKSGAGGVLPIASSPVNVTVELPTSSEYARCVVKLQALARGYVTRVHANRERVAMAAKTTGLLVALKEKEQGKSGWYQAPGGDVFYFVRDEQAEWLLAAGPISRSDYDEAIFNANSIGVIGTAKPVHSPRTASGSGRSVALLRKNGAGTATGVFSPLGDKFGPIEPGDVLRKCPFELAVDHEDVKGDLYLSNKTNKLYVAVSVDKLLLESLFAASASYLSGSVGINAGNSSLYTGTVEDSIVTQEDSSSSVI